MMNFTSESKEKLKTFDKNNNSTMNRQIICIFRRLAVDSRHESVHLWSHLQYNW